jgi:hypothetical protein
MGEYDGMGSYGGSTGGGAGMTGGAVAGGGGVTGGAVAGGGAVGTVGASVGTVGASVGTVGASEATVTASDATVGCVDGGSDGSGWVAHDGSPRTGGATYAWRGASAGCPLLSAPEPADCPESGLMATPSFLAA